MTPSKVTAVQRDLDAADGAAGRFDATTIRPSESRSVGLASRSATGYGKRPVAGAAAQRRRRFQPVGVGAGVEVPCAELIEHRADE